MSARKLTMPEFARATGRPIGEIKSMVSRGDLAFSPGRYLGRGQDSQPMFAPEIDSALVEQFAVGRAPVHDPLARRQAVERATWAKADERAENDAERAAIVAGDPEAVRRQAIRNLDALEEQAKAELFKIAGINR